MTQLRRIIEMKAEKKSDAFIAVALKISKERVNYYASFFSENKIGIEEIKGFTDEDLFRLVDAAGAEKKESLERLKLRFPHFEKELKKTGVTRKILWEEFQAEEKNFNSEGYSYSRFCFHFDEWRQQIDCYIPIEHKAGEMLFIDYAGDKLKILDGLGGPEKDVDVFVAILGASQLIYAEASHNQKSESFLRTLEKSLIFYGGTPQLIVCDNMKTAVVKPSRYEPDLNKNLERFAEHYNTAVLPARVRKPKDKPHVENAVKIIYQSIYARIRNETFFSVEALNARIREVLADLNNRSLSGCSYSRQQIFDEIEKPVLKSLCSSRYEMKKFASGAVRKNCHVLLSEDKKYYSAPFAYCRKEVSIVYDIRTVEIFSEFSRIALHERDFTVKKYITKKEHMPPNKEYSHDMDKVLKWAEDIGSHALEYVKTIIGKAKHPYLAYNTCCGILRLASANKYGKIRVNNACKNAATCGNYSLRVVENILSQNFDVIEAKGQLEMHLPVHENVRSNYI